MGDAQALRGTTDALFAHLVTGLLKPTQEEGDKAQMVEADVRIIFDTDAHDHVGCGSPSRHLQKQSDTPPVRPFRSEF